VRQASLVEEEGGSTLKLQIAARGESPSDDDGSRHVGSESCVVVHGRPWPRSVDSGHVGREVGSRNSWSWEPRLLHTSKATRMAAARPVRPSAPASRHPPTGIVVHGTHARVAQEPGMESRRSVARRNGMVREIEPTGRREVGARSRSEDVGEPAPGDPAEQRSAPVNRLVGGKR